MTGGAVVVLGPTGRNFAAGMSGGVAFVFDEDAVFERQCNLALVELAGVSERGDRALLRRLVERHARFTHSARARRLLAEWPRAIGRFVRVMPTEYRNVLALRQTSKATPQEITHRGRPQRISEAEAPGPPAAAGR